VAFETGVEIGRDVSFGHLRRRHDAVVLTGGAREPRDLPAPGRDLAGIHFAMPFLARQNRRLAGEEEKPGGGITAAGKSVLVVGGGDTGADCVGTAIRQGARRVLQIEIMPEPPAARSPSTPWPDWPLVRRDSSSHAEGGQRRWSATVKRFEGEGGAVARAVCAEVVWAAGAGGGRPAPEEKPGAEFTVEADLVLLATGFVGPGRIRGIEELGLEMDGRGFVRRDEARMTSAPGVFAAGDMAQGASLAVKAMADGLAAAAGVDAYVAGREGGRSK
jgi:glutamate synthase (NADPH/NADH) small chain